MFGISRLLGVTFQWILPKLQFAENDVAVAVAFFFARTLPALRRGYPVVPREEAQRRRRAHAVARREHAVVVGTPGPFWTAPGTLWVK